MFSKVNNMSQQREVSVVDLISTIDSKLKKVHTQSLDLSFNELLDMKKNQELDISPEFQRLFRWSEGARSRFIESLLLEMPVPPIYVIEQEEGEYLLIDGLQRISSYLHLRGELNAPHLETPVILGDKLILEDCDIVPELNGKTWDDLGTALQIRLKRAFVRVEVVRKGSDPRFQYHMFKRLNTGGALLSQQQIRNCTIRLLNPRFNDFIIELSQNESFRECIDSITQEQLLSAFDQELVLRFFAFKNNWNNFKHDVADFLTEYMEYVSDPDNNSTFDYVSEKIIFEKTFLILSKTMGNTVFGYANKDRSKIIKGFGVYHFEAISVGIQPVIESIDPENSLIIEQIKGILETVKLEEDFIRLVTGGGKNSLGQLKARIQYIENKLSILQ